MLLWSGAGIAVLFLVFHLAGGWYFSSQIGRRALSTEFRRDSNTPDYNTRVLALAGGTVTLTGPDDERLNRDGVFGVRWEGGWGVLGAISGRTPDGAVTREFTHQAGTGLAPGTLVSVGSQVYPEDPLFGRGIPFEEVDIAGEGGMYPAWFVPGRGSTWFVFVHGNSMARSDALRILPAIAGAGLPVLVPSYRGDPGAPDAPDGRLTYGKREWRDLEAAVRYALDNGAQSVVLEGMSMGGAVVMAFLLESPLAAAVSAVVFDAPLLDFERTVEFQAGNETIPFLGLPLPGTLVETAEWLAARRFGVDWAYTRYLDRARELRQPILLIHGTEDEDVPIATSEELARLRPDLVREFYAVPGAGHVEAWNVNATEYERRVLAFIAANSGK